MPETTTRQGLTYSLCPEALLVAGGAIVVIIGSWLPWIKLWDASQSTVVGQETTTLAMGTLLLALSLTRFLRLIDAPLFFVFGGALSLGVPAIVGHTVHTTEDIYGPIYSGAGVGLWVVLWSGIASGLAVIVSTYISMWIREESGAARPR